MTTGKLKPLSTSALRRRRQSIKRQRAELKRELAAIEAEMVKRDPMTKAYVSNAETIRKKQSALVESERGRW